MESPVAAKRVSGEGVGVVFLRLDETVLRIQSIVNNVGDHFRPQWVKGDGKEDLGKRRRVFDNE
jgi:hypothetical protein